MTSHAPVHFSTGVGKIEEHGPTERVITEETKATAHLPGDDPTAVDPANCRLVRLRTAKPAGSDNIVDVELVRPVAWIAASGVVPGGIIHFTMDELGLDGPADVVAVELCPPVKPGRGRVITGKFTTARCQVLDLRFAGADEVLHPTPPHRFFSEDRGEWIPASELRDGERVRTLSGRVLTVESIRLNPEPQRVYNYEVEGEHHYYVGQYGVLVHNAYNQSQAPKGMPEGDAWRYERYKEDGGQLGFDDWLPLSRGGRNGGPEHAAIQNMLVREQGLKPEQRIGNNWVDAAGPGEIHQIGDLNVRGDPVARERDVINSILQSDKYNNQDIFFWDKANPGQPIKNPHLLPNWGART